MIHQLAEQSSACSLFLHRAQFVRVVTLLYLNCQNFKLEDRFLLQKVLAWQCPKCRMKILVICLDYGWKGVLLCIEQYCRFYFLSFPLPVCLLSVLFPYYCRYESFFAWTCVAFWKTSLFLSYRRCVLCWNLIMFGSQKCRLETTLLRGNWDWWEAGEEHQNWEGAGGVRVGGKTFFTIFVD